LLNPPLTKGLSHNALRAHDDVPNKIGPRLTMIYNR
jgi:hypothetical protein